MSTLVPTPAHPHGDRHHTAPALGDIVQWDGRPQRVVWALPHEVELCPLRTCVPINHTHLTLKPLLLALLVWDAERGEYRARRDGNR